MAENFVLVVSEDKDGKYGEISVLDTAHETERLVETLVEAGLEQDRILVFAGAEAEFVTSHRPVVTLTAEANQTTEEARLANNQAEPEVVVGRAQAEGTPAEGTPVEATSGNGRSVSSLFRSARDDKLEVYMSASEAAS